MTTCRAALSGRQDSFMKNTSIQVSSVNYNQAITTILKATSHRAEMAEIIDSFFQRVGVFSTVVLPRWIYFLPTHLVNIFFFSPANDSSPSRRAHYN
jgi:hypothetical protein